MRHKPYPWRAVETVRENDETAAQKRHSERVNELQTAREALEQIARAKRQKEIALAALAKAWMAPQESCSAAQAQRQAAYAQRLREQSEAMKASIEKAENRVRESRERVAQARAGLQEAHAGRKALQRHRDGFEIAQKKDVERQTEIEAEDNTTARRAR